MADDVFVMLTWMASYSKFYSIMVVLMCFMVMVIFILRLNSDQIFWPLPSSPIPLVPRQDMIKLTNPYVLRIDALETTELHSGVEINVSCQYPCLLTCLWAVGIDSLHEALQHPSDQVMVELDSREFLQAASQQSQTINILEPCNDLTIELICPMDIAELELHKPPRQSYPLAILLSLPLGLDNITVTDTDVVLSVYIIHLKDEECPMKSQFVGHYIKLYNGNLLNLQHLFLSASDTTSDSSKQRHGDKAYVQTEVNDEVNSQAEDRDRDHNQGETTPELSDSSCIVCQSAGISTVLLPCRHTCVCNTCFLQIDKCPMCRSVIESYFRLSGCSEGATPLHTEQSSNSSGTLLSKWERWNRRLNQYLGFTE